MGVDPDGPEQALAADWPETWRFYERHRDEFRQALGTFRLGRDDAMELAHEFVLARLPQVVARTRNLSEGDAARYLRAALRNYARTTLRRFSRERAALEQLAVTLQFDTNEPQLDLTPVGLDELGLQEVHRNALRLYFGLDGREHSVREIARVLGLGRHSASQAIIDGLAAAALVLRLHGSLDSREYSACRAVLLDGISIARAAEDFSLPTERVRRSLRMLRAAGTYVVQGAQEKSHGSQR